MERSSATAANLPADLEDRLEAYEKRANMLQEQFHDLGQQYTRLEVENQALRTWVVARVVTLWEAVQNHGERTSHTMQGVVNAVSNDAARHREFVDRLDDSFRFLGIPPPPAVPEAGASPLPMVVIPVMPPPPATPTTPMPSESPRRPLMLLEAPNDAATSPGPIPASTPAPTTLTQRSPHTPSANPATLAVVTPTRRRLADHRDSGSEMDRSEDEGNLRPFGGAGVAADSVDSTAAPATTAPATIAPATVAPAAATPLLLTAAPSRSFSRAPSNPPPTTTRTHGGAKRALSAIPESGDTLATKKQKHS